MAISLHPPSTTPNQGGQDRTIVPFPTPQPVRRVLAGFSPGTADLLADIGLIGPDVTSCCTLRDAMAAIRQLGGVIDELVVPVASGCVDLCDAAQACAATGQDLLVTGLAWRLPRPELVLGECRRAHPGVRLRIVELSLLPAYSRSA